MPQCEYHVVRWKNRPAYTLTNGVIELTVLLGGGHIADLRLAGSSLNALWESPWQTIDPQTFSASQHAPLYGDGAVGKFLSGYTGHALALGYFGMPSDSQAAQGLPLHGEAAGAEWEVAQVRQDGRACALTLQAELPVSQLGFRREIRLQKGASTVSVRETVTNRSNAEVEFQWVQHASFGEPLLASGEARLYAPVARAVTWPLGYEGHELLPNDVEFAWPNAPSVSGDKVDLSEAFPKDGTGFVAALLTEPSQTHSYAVIHNRRLNIIAGYCFERARFPWIALWEENRARQYAPWNGITRVRGVEFGTSPMPLGLEHARRMRTLFDTPVLAKLAPEAELSTEYEMFVTPAPAAWREISDVVRSENSLVIRETVGAELRLQSSRSATEGCSDRRLRSSRVRFGRPPSPGVSGWAR